MFGRCFPIITAACSFEIRFPKSNNLKSETAMYFQKVNPLTTINETKRTVLTEVEKRPKCSKTETKTKKATEKERKINPPFSS